MTDAPTPTEWLAVFFEQEKSDEMKNTIAEMIGELKISFPD